MPVSCAVEAVSVRLILDLRVKGEGLMSCSCVKTSIGVYWVPLRTATVCSPALLILPTDTDADAGRAFVRRLLQDSCDPVWPMKELEITKCGWHLIGSGFI